MSAAKDQQVIQMLRGLIIERQRLLIREANYLRGLVGLPPVRADRERDQASTPRRCNADSQRGSE